MGGRANQAKTRPGRSWRTWPRASRSKWRWRARSALPNSCAIEGKRTASGERRKRALATTLATPSAMLATGKYGSNMKGRAPMWRVALCRQGPRGAVATQNAGRWNVT
eukprot:2392618-Pyramimonas_sp.AAC.1